MKATRTQIEFARLPKDYAGLCRMLTPRPIRDKVDFENVTEITDAMAGRKLTADQEDYFDLLCRLIEDYEKEHAQLDTSKVTALDALQKYIFDQYYVVMMYARANVIGYVDRFLPGPNGFFSNLNWNAEV